jgi:hypothetical protein
MIKTILILLAINYTPVSPPEPNDIPFAYDANMVTAPILKWYVGEPNAVIFFDFKVTEPDGNDVNVSVIGTRYIFVKPPVKTADSNDPNGVSVKHRYKCDVKTSREGVLYLKIKTDDRQLGDNRPLDDPNDDDGPKSDTRFILVWIRKEPPPPPPKPNRPPVIGL